MEHERREILVDRRSAKGDHLTFLVCTYNRTTGTNDQAVGWLIMEASYLQDSISRLAYVFGA